ncbi:lipid asymmetry maintenance protein MlaB [Enterobacillus tribolii]|uniref:Phospholipid transport system transporter-binding protein n=1 Tax=Enterobacillus tribolii TaxID=1487935 RepID=A0A370QQE5_9GAMM|nr:lipid asymmetry maintenance protein MlaB [Enterobacillus tribolii]MBW7981629.1 lipid asymmetry maintenance protein MlaB [Enterobacillus tribolii]RDK91008.1 phospholipid transport system transporter-binding protein [Enterobacillus tribolii]
MSNGALSWQKEGQTLKLSGALDRDSLLALWDTRQSALQGVSLLDVSALQRVDSAGLAMLVHLQNEGRPLALSGITDRLRTLIALYNLSDIIVTDESAPVG